MRMNMSRMVRLRLTTDKQAGDYSDDDDDGDGNDNAHAHYCVDENDDDSKSDSSGSQMAVTVLQKYCQR